MKGPEEVHLIGISGVGLARRTLSWLGSVRRSNSGR